MKQKHFPYKQALIYHDIFDYPLTAEELERWKPGRKFPTTRINLPITKKGPFYFLQGREGVVKGRLEKEKYSKKKMALAREASGLLARIPTVRMVGVTGSVAMAAAHKGSDVDLMVITARHALWSTRLLGQLLLRASGMAVRNVGNPEEKNRLCLNIWLDERALVWRRKNVYTAHEICQIVPLVNNGGVYERFISANKWVGDYWPQALALAPRRLKLVSSSKRGSYGIGLFESLAYKLQRWGRKRISTEVVTPTRALFHPVDWSATVLGRLKAR